MELVDCYIAISKSYRKTKYMELSNKLMIFQFVVQLRENFVFDERYAIMVCCFCLSVLLPPLYNRKGVIGSGLCNG